MKLPQNPIKTVMLCTAAAVIFVLSACGPDQNWINKRTKALVGQPIPGTKVKYDEATARKAAEDEDLFSRHGAAAYVAGPALDAMGSMSSTKGEDPNRISNAMFKAPAPASMTVNPPVQPTMPMGHCFVTGTLVQTPAGAREIQSIRAGDTVFSFNERKGSVEPARVTKVITGYRSDLMVLTSAHGSVTCSQNHRFLTAESRWTMASVLSASDKVMALGTDFTGVVPMKCAAKHKDLDSPVTVHNFEVEGNHDYFVGPDAILCHNTK